MSTNNKIKVGIAGAAGYTGGELIRLLLHHPFVDIVFVNSKSNAGKKVYEVHQDLLGACELNFSEGIDEHIDGLFLCLGHGESVKFIKEHSISDEIRIIDLSQDFRPGQINRSGKEFVYGLCESNKAAIKKAANIANPGCFATCIQLALLPLAEQGWLQQPVQISATTGSTGAGQSLSATSHFSWRNNNLSVYKAFEHQHLKEIKKNLAQVGGMEPELAFIPMRGAFTRGILATVHTSFDKTQSEFDELYKSYYADSAFVQVAPFAVDLKQVVNTNNCFLQLEKYGNEVLITSVIDNLLKGASGQAVQNMNLMFGLEETSGLKLKPVAF